jgi:hypothetical protein
MIGVGIIIRRIMTRERYITKVTTFIKHPGTRDSIAVLL